ncbi:MAG TPA: SpoIIE family protein phosphatase [Aliidongia sp.]|nr:SpoIIE family protein phosphatase [Aliidongia sp.]
MIGPEELVWNGETQPTLAGIRELRRSLADRLAKLPLGREVGEDLSVALVEIGVNVVEHASGASRLLSELKHRDHEWTLTVADNGKPLLRDAAAFNEHATRRPDPLQESGRGLYIVAARFPQHLYVPATWHARGHRDLNRFIIRAFEADAPTVPRILVVDDDPVQRMAIELYLRGPYRVIACASAAEAELEAKLQTPDLIISDIHMPDDDGLAFRDRLSKAPELGLVPFLFLTSDRSPGASAAANEAGIDDMLYKPLDKTRLLSVLARILKRQEQTKALRRHEAVHTNPTNRFAGPALPAQIGPFTMAARRVSAGQTIDVNVAGGDNIWHRHTPDGFQLMLCDAMGHGADAWPLAMANLGFVKGAAMGMGPGIGPGTFIATLSDLLSDEGLLQGATLTALGCWLRDDGTLSLANAGQPHPLLAKGGTVEEIMLEGGLLGLLPDQQYDEKSLALAPGDRLVLFTDGFVEAADPAVAKLAVEALKADLASLADRPVPVIADGLLRAHLLRSGGRTEDDSMVCVLGIG